MIRQYLSNKNESTTVSLSKKFQTKQGHNILVLCCSADGEDRSMSMHLARADGKRGWGQRPQDSRRCGWFASTANGSRARGIVGKICRRAGILCRPSTAHTHSQRGTLLSVPTTRLRCFLSGETRVKAGIGLMQSRFDWNDQLTFNQPQPVCRCVLNNFAPKDGNGYPRSETRWVFLY